MDFLKRDVELIQNNPSQLKAIGEKINQLYACEDLDELDAQILDFFVTKVTYTERQLELLEAIWKTYK